LRLRDLMTQEQREQEDAWNNAKWISMVSYVKRLSRADQAKWAERQTELTKQKMREALQR
jgi:hypothetical protein